MYYCFIIFNLVLVVKSELIFTNVIWRHGDRSTLHPFPDDPPDLWPRGLGQLTNQGIKQEYELGRFLRSQYGKIVSAEYKPEEIYIRSTAVDRALMSAQACMDGFYRPSANETWNGEKTAWFPVPVHSADMHNDILLQPDKHPCPNYNKSIEEVKNSKWYIAFDSKYSGLYKMLEEKTGLTDVNTLTLSMVQDNLVCKAANNISLPDWATPGIRKKLEYIAGIRMGLKFSEHQDDSHRKKVARMMIGTFIKQVLKDMQNKIDQKTNLSMVAYSAHDSNLAEILVGINAFNSKTPPYGSCIMMELHKDDSGYNVQFKYRNESNHAPYPISFCGCNKICSWETFKTLASDIIPEDHDKICGYVPYAEKLANIYKVLLYLAFVLLVASWIVIAFILKKNYCTKKDLTYRLLADHD